MGDSETGTPAAGHEVGVLVHHEVGETETPERPHRFRSADHDAQPSDELLEVDRFRDVVVRAGGDPPHSVFGARAPGEEHERCGVSGIPEAAAHLEPVDVHEVHFEHDGVDGWVDRSREGTATRIGRLHVEAVVLQRRLEGGVAVVDEEHRRASHGDPRWHVAWER